METIIITFILTLVLANIFLNYKIYRLIYPNKFRVVKKLDKNTYSSANETNFKYYAEGRYMYIFWDSLFYNYDIYGEDFRVYYRSPERAKSAISEYKMRKRIEKDFKTKIEIID